MRMQNKIIKLVGMLILIIASFFIGLNFYKNEDVNHDGKVDIKDLLIVQKYILEEGDK